MKRSIRDQWVEDLRSGKYPQGRNGLHKGGQFCCLGVLAEQACVSGVASRAEVGYFMKGSTRPFGGLLHSDLLGWSGLTKDAQYQLSYRNDIEEASFEKIAAWIERHL